MDYKQYLIFKYKLFNKLCWFCRLAPSPKDNTQFPSVIKPCGWRTVTIFQFWNGFQPQSFITLGNWVEPYGLGVKLQNQHIFYNYHTYFNNKKLFKHTFLITSKQNKKISFFRISFFILIYSFVQTLLVVFSMISF